MVQPTYAATYKNTIPENTGPGLRTRTLTKKGAAFAENQSSKRPQVTQPHQPRQSDVESLRRKINELPELPELPEMHVVSGQTKPPVNWSVLDRPIASCSGLMSLPTTTDHPYGHDLPSLTGGDVQSFFIHYGRQQFNDDMSSLDTLKETVRDALS